MTNLTEMSNEEFQELRLAVLNEAERRDRLTNVPLQVATLARQFHQDGGELSTLQTLIENTPTSPKEPQEPEENPILEDEEPQE